jgi:MFS family permease
MTASWHEFDQVRHAQRRTVRVLSAAQVLGGVGIGVAGSLGALLAEDVTHSETLAGIARTAATLGAAVVGLPLALLAMRWGRRGALSLGWALALVGAVVLVVAAARGDVVLLVVGMLLFGSGSATNLQSRYAAADLAAPLHRARALSLVIWSTTVGSVVGPNLAAPGAVVSRALHLPKLAGGFLISGVFLLAAAALIWFALRPDPLLLARRFEAEQQVQHEGAVEAARAGGAPVRSVLAEILAVPRARFAFVAVVLGHTVMGAVMTMTPLHMTDHGMSLTIVGITISVHVLGMYGFSPLVGWLADRYGRVPTVLVGQVAFAASAVLAGTSGGSMARVTAGLFLLGLGWSFALVAGSALLTESVRATLRPAAQGTADTTMNVVAAIAAGASGPAMTTMGFGGLNVLAGVLIVPVGLLAVALGRSSQHGPGVQDALRV